MNSGIKFGLCPIMMIIFAFEMLAGTVSWNVFEQNTMFDGSDQGARFSYYDFSVSPELEVAYSYNHARLTGFKTTEVTNLGSPYSLWVLAYAGDILTHDYFYEKHALGGDVVFDSLPAASGLTHAEGQQVCVNNGETFYIAMLGFNPDMTSVDPHTGEYTRFTEYYAWMSVDALQTSLELNTSALTYSPNLIVGTGEFAPTPEPTTGLLVLLGIGILALRRKTEV